MLDSAHIYVFNQVVTSDSTVLLESIVEARQDTVSAAQLSTLPPTVERIHTWSNTPSSTIFLLTLFILISFLFKRTYFYYEEFVTNYFREDHAPSSAHSAYHKDMLSQLILWSISIISVSFFTVLAYNTTFSHSIEFLSTDRLSLALYCTTGILLFKYMAIKILGYAMIDRKQLKSFITNYFTTTGLTCILLLPIVIGMIYSTENYRFMLLNSGYIILAIGALLLIFKLFQTFFVNLSSFFYLFLYLCTLEILPVLVLRKVLLIGFGNV